VTVRHHLLSFTAAGLGIALGLGLGAGPVAEDTVASHDSTTEALEDRVARLEARVQDLRAAARDDEKVVAELAAPLVADRLAGRRVLVVATPGATKGVVRRVRTRLEAAGATVTGVLTLTKTYLDPSQAQAPLEDLALRLVPPGVEFADGTSAIERVGAVLARATVTKPADREQAAGPDASRPAGRIDRDAAEVIAGLDELDALRLDGKPGRLADLAVVVSGPGDAPESEAALAGLLRALDAGSLGAVLTAPGRADAGVLRWVRDATGDQLEGSLTTVDSLDTPVGTALLVLALAEQASGGSGDYGLGRGARDVVPVVPVPPVAPVLPDPPAEG